MLIATIFYFRTAVWMHECLLTSVQMFLQYQPQFWKSVFQTAETCENSAKSYFSPLDSQVSAFSVGVVAAASNKDKSNNITSNEYSPLLFYYLILTSCIFIWHKHDFARYWPATGCRHNSLSIRWPLSLVPYYQAALYTLRLSDISSHLEIAIDTIMFFTIPVLGLMKW